RFGVGAAELGGDGDLLDHPSEDLAALGIGPFLLVLDVGPLGMTRHRLLYLAILGGRAIIHPAEEFRFYHPGTPRARPPALPAPVTHESAADRAKRASRNRTAAPTGQSPWPDH